LRYKDKLAKKKSQQDRLLGQLEAKKKELKKLGYASIKEAEEALDELDEEIATMEDSLEKDVKSFVKEFGDLL
jgi:septal ring factor EnvC (AmiA/AmiB activator)